MIIKFYVIYRTIIYMGSELPPHVLKHFIIMQNKFWGC